MTRSLIICLVLLCWGVLAYADNASYSHQYQVEIEAPSPLKTLLENHLDIIKWRTNPRMSPSEWKRLSAEAPKQIKELLATEGYFSPEVSVQSTQNQLENLTTLSVNPGTPTVVNSVNITFSGDITQPHRDLPSIEQLREEWPLPVGTQFQQAAWTAAKRSLVTKLLVNRYPNAVITDTKASIDIQQHTASLELTVDSGNTVHFGELEIEGLERYPESIIHNLNPIKPNEVYSQSKLLTFQTRLQESGYFRTVEVTADSKAALTDQQQAPIKIKVNENQSIKVSTGAGFSTNTGARTQLTVEHLNVFDRNWRLTSTLRLEQKLQSISGTIRLPTTASGYRDSANIAATRTEIEGQTTTLTQAGVKRAWGSLKREQYVGANLLAEHVNLDSADSSDTYAATLGYGITLRRTDNNLNPTRGYLFNAQFNGAPLASLSNGTFLQSYLKTQAYYPITKSTQLIARAELGMVSGKNSAPATFLFRAGGDQSVRGYGYQSLGVTEGDAIVGARYLTTGSIEIIQWLTPEWGAAIFTDFGNAANSIKELKPVYGYGLGARWKSPVGPIGADIAYGQATDDYRLHFNIGVIF
ncbi:autotransporter assembly complex protein TamA [Methylotenera mobilis]|uniref:Translocation and assembly module subunit TamA n=1 Tax=Methylotenera mobilis (strain JLW8 / ATCC BAA-1282 / DSM 17540) TaxID=583345 RepID=C6WUQ5_METML|nr:autotransporter assembly complex family protein [Methylotenera mobilis]ACT47654.1 surface antigen (D15) [Methylotenera mobilis JLW8]